MVVCGAVVAFGMGAVAKTGIGLERLRRPSQKWKPTEKEGRVPLSQREGE